MTTLALMLAIVLLTGAGLYARRRLPQIDDREARRAEFFRAAMVLAEREETPGNVLAVIHFIGQKVGDRWAPYKLLHFLLHGDARRTAQEPGPKLAQLRRDVESMPKDLREQFGKAVVTGIMAITLNSVAVGWLLRRMAFYRVTQRNKRSYDGSDDAGIVASGWACGTP